MRNIAIVQARTGSKRLPNKVFADLYGKPLIWHIIKRLKYSSTISDIVLATTVNKSDDLLVKWCKQEHINYFRGSEDNVLSRFFYAAQEFKADIIIRITADDPFKDPNIIDQIVNHLNDQNLDFAFNNNPPTFPEGLDVEVFSYEALKRAFHNANTAYEKEHVTQYFYKNKGLFKTFNLENSENLSYLRWTIDTDKDLEMAQTVYNILYQENKLFYFEDVLKLIKQRPEIAMLNINETRSDMYKQ